MQREMERQVAQPQLALDTAGSKTRNTVGDKEGQYIIQRGQHNKRM